MSILKAASQPELIDAAFGYLDSGCSIIPVAGKRPALPWDEFKNFRPSSPRVGYWFRSGRMKGIGLVCGSVSGGGNGALIVIDVDSQDACAEFETAFPRILDTLTIRSGSGRGKHYYYYSRVATPNAWRSGVELRSDGAYVVAPPSIHPDSGQPYSILKALEPLQVGSLEPVRQWILRRSGGGNAPKPAPKPPGGNGVRHSSRYGAAALLDEASKVAHAAEGEGNNTLYRAALKCGSLVASGHLTQAEAEYFLEMAAAGGLSVRDGIEATRRTIASGLRTGMGSPRSVR